jgi:hypothetical protein
VVLDLIQRQVAIERIRWPTGGASGWALPVLFFRRCGGMYAMVTGTHIVGRGARKEQRQKRYEVQSVYLSKAGIN